MFYFPAYHLTDSANGTNVTDPNCTLGVPWIWKVMSDCVRTDNEIASTYLGLASMVIWMTCGIPQMIKNCRYLDGMAGISFYLMFQWFLGDSANLIGSILTKQLKIQIYVAVWYVTSDTILLCQYVAYRIKNKRPVLKEFNVQTVLCIGGLFLLGGAKTYHQFSPLGSMAVPQSLYTHHSTGRNLLMVSSHVGHMHLFKNNVELTGYIIGSISAVFYVGSRFSQIYTNVFYDYMADSPVGFTSDQFEDKCPPVPKVLLDGACAVRICNSDRECEDDTHKCCYNGCTYTCRPKVQPAAFVDWIQEPRRRLSSGRSWLVNGPDTETEVEICSTSPVDIDEDPLLCPHGYFCNIEDEGDPNNGIPNRGNCVKQVDDVLKDAPLKWSAQEEPAESNEENKTPYKHHGCILDDQLIMDQVSIELDGKICKCDGSVLKCKEEEKS